MNEHETEVTESQRRPKINLNQNLVHSDEFIILYIQQRSKDEIISSPGEVLVKDGIILAHEVLVKDGIILAP